MGSVIADTKRAGARWARTREAVARSFVVVGALLLLLGAVAGYAHRELLGANAFAGRVDDLRRVPQVSRALGHAVTDAYVTRNPDAVAVRPLIDAVTTSLAGSDALSVPTRTAARSANRAFTEPGSDDIVLRLADVGSVVTALLHRLTTTGTATSDSPVSVELARIGGQSFAGRTLRLSVFVERANWALPSTAAVLIVGGIALSRRRRHAVLLAGISVIASAGILALALLGTQAWASHQDDSTLSGALLRHGYGAFVASLWWTAAALAVTGLLVTAAATALLPRLDPFLLIRRTWSVVSSPPPGSPWRAVTGCAAAVIGGAALAYPGPVVRVITVLCGAGLFLYGVQTVTTAVGTTRGTLPHGSPPPAAGGDVRPSTGAGAGAAALVAALVVVGLVAWGVTAGPPATAATDDPGAGDSAPGTCNGSARLCDRRFTDVVFVGSHNAMSIATDRTWFIPEQGRSLTGQLDLGVRSLLVDVWPGYPAAGGRVSTARSAYAQARAEAERDFGPDTVAAGLRVFDALSNPTPTGPERLYMCHGLCELGASDFSEAMTRVRAWLDQHPDEIISLIIEDHADSRRIATALHDTGLADLALTPPHSGAAWPTLRQMISSGHRTLIALEAGTGGAADPWLVNAFTHLIQDTPYTFATAGAFACDPNRGDADAPLVLVNHWLAGFDQLVTNARTVNARSMLEGRVEQCRTHGRTPSIIAVNYVDVGDLVAVVDRLNAGQ